MIEDNEDVKRIKSKLLELGPVLPGSLSKQWNVCGKPGCRCKDPEKPKKHGPYHQLSFTLNGRSSTLFVKPQDLIHVRQCIRRHAQLKALCTELVETYVQDLRKPKGRK